MRIELLNEPILTEKYKRLLLDIDDMTLCLYVEIVNKVQNVDLPYSKNRLPKTSCEYQKSFKQLESLGLINLHYGR